MAPCYPLLVAPEQERQQTAQGWESNPWKRLATVFASWCSHEVPSYDELDQIRHVSVARNYCPTQHQVRKPSSGTTMRAVGSATGRYQTSPSPRETNQRPSAEG